jgi:hypothetical protein
VPAQTILSGEIHDFEKPDFKIDWLRHCGHRGKPASTSRWTGCFSSPLAEKSFHEKVVYLAEQEYNDTPGAEAAAEEEVSEDGAEARVIVRLVWVKSLIAHQIFKFSLFSNSAINPTTVSPSPLLNLDSESHLTEISLKQGRPKNFSQTFPFLVSFWSLAQASRSTSCHRAHGPRRPFSPHPTA